MKKPPSQRLKATAYHEAGHAVVSLEYRRSVKHATIIAESGKRGERKAGQKAESGTGPLLAIWASRKVA